MADSCDWNAPTDNVLWCVALVLPSVDRYARSWKSRQLAVQRGSLVQYLDAIYDLPSWHLPLTSSWNDGDINLLLFFNLQGYICILDNIQVWSMNEINFPSFIKSHILPNINKLYYPWFGIRQARPKQQGQHNLCIHLVHFGFSRP